MRLLLYCASNIGLGHLHRLTRIVAALREEIPDLDALLITDTQTLTASEIDPELGLIRLPSFEFREDSFRNRPAALGLNKQELRDLRANLILAAATGFQPHAVLMDTNPHGKRNELEPLLKQLGKASMPPLRILQLRDIPFPPEESSRLSGDPARLAEDFALYDEIVVAGDRSFFDLARNYDWPEEIAGRLEYLGFVLPVSEDVEDKSVAAENPAAGVSTSGEESRSKPIPVERWEGEGGAVNPEEPAEPAVRERQPGSRALHIVAAMGGGWELEAFGHPVVDAYLHLYPEGGHGAHFTLFTGPAVAQEAFENLVALVKGRPDIRIERYTREFAEELRRCDLAVLQAGSTAFQILESEIPMLIYSREYSTAEQLTRAERLAVFPGVEQLWREDLEPARLAGRMKAMLEAPRVKRKTGFGFSGAERAAMLIANRLREHR